MDLEMTLTTYNNMQQILQNLAMIDLITYCKANNIDPSATHLAKNGRGFKYSLCHNKTGRAIVTVTFHKNQVPTHSINPNNN